MHYERYWWLGILVLGLAGCSTSPSDMEFDLRTLAKGSFSGIQEPEQKILRTQEAWNRFWKRHSGEAETAQKLPEVNFSKEMVVAATMGRQRTGGYSIEIQRVRYEDKELLVEIRRTTPPPGAMTIQSLTAPFHFVAMPRSNLPAQFVSQKVRGNVRENPSQSDQNE